MKAPKRYFAFVSYTHSDRRWAKWVHRAVETYRLPARIKVALNSETPFSGRLAPVFLDREELSTSASLADSVREALESSQHLIVVCSPRAAASRWVNEEVRLFKEMGRGSKIICVIVDGEPNAAMAGNPAAECFPPAVRYAVIDGVVTDTPVPEPLAADLRTGMDGARPARLKIVAGLLGVNLDELRRRDQARRMRRLTALAAAAGLGCLVLAGLTTAALISRSEAQRQRQIAERKSLTASRTAEFMKSLFAVADPSEARGNSVTAREILDRGATQIRSGLEAEPEVRADLMTTLGEVYTGLGLYRDAAKLVDDAYRVPGQPSLTHARQSIALGEIEFLNAKYAHSRELMDQAIAALRASEEKDTALLARALAGRGEALTAEENYGEAGKTLNEALALVGASEDTIHARVIEALGDNAFFAGDLDDAERRYHEALALRMKLSGENHPRVAFTLETLGSIGYLRNDSAMAASMYERALQIDRKVLGMKHPETGGTMNNLARVYLEDRQFQRAARLLEESRNLKLAELEETHDDMAFIFSNLAIARMGLGEPAAAEPLFEKGLRAAVLHKHRLHGPILTDLADLKCRTGRAAEGLKLLDEARPIVTARYPDDPWRAALVDNVRAGCLTGEKRFAEADALIASSTPPLLAKWGPKRLYGYDAIQRARRLYALTRNETRLAEYDNLANR